MPRTPGLFLLFLLTTPLISNAYYFEGPLCYPLGFLVQPLGLCEDPNNPDPAVIYNTNNTTELTTPPARPAPTSPVPAPPTERIIERIIEQPIVEERTITEYITVEGNNSLTEQNLADFYAYVDTLSASQFATAVTPTSATTPLAFNPQNYTPLDLFNQQIDSLQDDVTDDVRDLRSELTADITASASQWTTSGSVSSLVGGMWGWGRRVLISF